MAEHATLLGAYDPALAEAVREGDDDDEISVIVRLSGDETLPEGVRIVTRFGDIATLRVQRGQLTKLAACGSVIALEAARRLRLTDARDHRQRRDPTDDTGSITRADESAPIYTRRPAGVVATGRGVIVAVLDWGIDFAHPAFRHPGRDADGQAGGSTRLLALWDQRGGKSSDPGNPWGYGRIHTREAINRALREPDPYQALGYHPGDSDERDAESGEWKGAHGTHVSDIAAGNGRGGGMVGVAPEADLVFIHLSRTTRVLGEGNLGDSTSVIEAIDAAFSIAGDRPCVINMSVGAQGGPHDGTTLVEQGIDQAVWLKPGRAAVNSGGNYFDARAHACGRLKQNGEDVLRFSVPTGDPTDSELEIYYESVDRFVATIIDPYGTELATVVPGQDSPMSVEGRVVGHVYHHVREATNGDRLIDLFLKPDAPGGIWQVRLKADVVQDGRYHAWIERDYGLRPVFVAPNVEQNFSTGTLACGRFSITAGAYNPHRPHRPIGHFSSAGPTRDGRVKPELCAPGVGITAGRSTPPLDAPAARYTTKDGTSMAAPHVTGALALMFSCVRKPLEISETRALLFGSTDCASIGDDIPASDLHRLGYGYLNIAAAERAAREWDRAGIADQPEHSAFPGEDAGGGKGEQESSPEFADEPVDRSPAEFPTVHSISGGTTMIDTVESAERMRWLGLPDDPVWSEGEAVSFGEQDPVPPVDPLPGATGHEEDVSIDDVAVEMDGLPCSFVRDFMARRSDGTSRSFSANSFHLVESWNGTAPEAVIERFTVPKVILAPEAERVPSLRRYDVPLAAQRRAVVENMRELREWIAQEGSYRSNRSLWEREKRRLEELLARRQVIYSRLWVRQMMYNRFDADIARWTQHYNSQLDPRPDLDPNIVKSLIYQESRMGTSGAHLMPPPYDWSSSDRHPIRSRFNIGQAIDSWGPQQWLMMREMAPTTFGRYGLDAFAARRQWLGMSNDEYSANGQFMRALRDFFAYRDGDRNLMGTRGRDLHEDYGFWIRTAIRWLFLKFSSLTPSTWSDAVRAYNGSGSRARRYRDAVMTRVGSLAPFTEDLRNPESRPEELFGPVARGYSDSSNGRSAGASAIAPAPGIPAEQSNLDVPSEDRTRPSQDRSAVLAWEDLTRIPDSSGQQQLFYVITGAPPGVAAIGDEGQALFRLRVRNTNAVYNHQDVLTKHRVLDLLSRSRNFRVVEIRPGGRCVATGATTEGWIRCPGAELEDESSRVITFRLGPDNLRLAYNSDYPLTRLEVEYHWRESGEDYQKHFNQTGLDFVLVAPIEFLFGRQERLTPRDIELSDPDRYKNDFWIPIAGVNFTQDLRTPVPIQLTVSSSVSGTAGAQQTATTSQSRSTTVSHTASRTFSAQLSAELSRGGSATANIEILELGVQQMLKLGGSLGFSRTVTDTRSTTVAQEFSRSLTLSRSYTTGRTVSSTISTTITPPEAPGPSGTGRSPTTPGPAAVGVGSVGVYLYPVVAYFRVPYVRFEGVNGLGQATRRTEGFVAVPYVTEWRVTSQRGT